MTTTATDDARPAQASTLPMRRPGTHRAPPSPRPAGPPGYDLDRAWHLLAATCELPATERGLLKILTEYRKALHALATQLQATQRAQCAQQPPDPGTTPHQRRPGHPEPSRTTRAMPAGTLSISQAAAIRPVIALLTEHRDLLPPAPQAGLRELHDGLSERLCPYPTAQLEARTKELNERFPDYEHWYIRAAGLGR